MVSNIDQILFRSEKAGRGSVLFFILLIISTITIFIILSTFGDSQVNNYIVIVTGLAILSLIVSFLGYEFCADYYLTETEKNILLSINSKIQEINKENFSSFDKKIKAIEDFLITEKFYERIEEWQQYGNNFRILLNHYKMITYEFTITREYKIEN